MTAEPEGGYLLHAWQNHRAEMDERLGAPFYTELLGWHEELFGPLEPVTPPPAPEPESAVGVQTSKISVRGGLTQAQDDALDMLEPLMAQARDSARRAFKGQGVKLRNDYQIGEQDSRTLGDILERADLIAASCVRDAVALKAKGWSPKETTKLKNAISAVEAPDAGQVAALREQKEATDARNILANEYNEGLLILQNAANIEWMAGAVGNVGVRSEFRLGMFPRRTVELVLVRRLRAHFIHPRCIFRPLSELRIPASSLRLSRSIALPRSSLTMGRLLLRASAEGVAERGLLGVVRIL